MGGGWQPISTAPRDGTDVMRHDKHWGVMSGYWSDCIWARYANPDKDAGGAWVQELNRSDTLALNPTHWMPLPEPPEAV